MGDIGSPTHPHSHVLSIKTWKVEVFFEKEREKEKKKENKREWGRECEWGSQKKKTWETNGRSMEKRKKRKREGKGAKEEEGFLYFHAVLIICSDQGAFMV